LKIIIIFWRLIFILWIPVLLLSASIAWGFNSLWIYTLGFQKYQVSQATGISTPDLEKAGRGMIEYFNSKEEFVQITVNLDGKPINLFIREEQIHLRDVKKLVWLDYEVLILSIIYTLGFVIANIFLDGGKKRSWLAKSLLWGCGLSFILILVMGTGTLVDFDQLFLQFHFLAFSNDFWSAPGYMIALFGGLWYDAVLIGVGFMAGLAVLLAAISLTYLLTSRNAMQNNKMLFL